VITGQVGTVGFDSSSSQRGPFYNYLSGQEEDLPVPDDQRIGIPGSKTRQGRTGARNIGPLQFALALR
jgi:hypothetical protein